MNNRSPALDVLRCIAVVLVMLRHYHISSITTRVGWMGVDLFFVLSGFLVSGLLFDEYLKTGDVKGRLFLVRRGFKIYPTFWFVLIIHLFYFFYKGHLLTGDRVLAELLFVQNFFENIMGISWTLAIEEHFYFLLLFLVWIFLKKGLLKDWKWVMGTGLFILCFCLTLRFYLYTSQPFNDWTHVYPTYIRIDSLVFGVLISWFYHFRPNHHQRFLKRYKSSILFVVLAGIAMPFFFAYDDLIMNTIGLTLLYIAFGGVICLVKKLRIFHSKWFKPFVYIGRCSYAIYLVHLLCGPIVANLFRVYIVTDPSLEWINDLINFLSNIGIGILLSLLIEQPILKFRDRYFPRSNNHRSPLEASLVEVAAQ